MPVHLVTHGGQSAEQKKSNGTEPEQTLSDSVTQMTQALDSRWVSDSYRLKCASRKKN